MSASLLRMKKENSLYSIKGRRSLAVSQLEIYRRSKATKHAFAVREKYGIRFEDVFTQNGMDSKYGPEAIEDY